MTKRLYDGIVIGCGLMGAAAAWQMARDGRRVLLLEQFEVGHGRGSSHGGSRIFRYTHPTPDYAALMPAIAAEWRALERESGEQLLEMTGGLYVAGADDAFLGACRATLDSLGMGYEWLDAPALRQRYPQFRVDEGWAGLVQAESGILAASRCVESLARAAVRRGAELHENARVTGIFPDGEGVRVSVAEAGGQRDYFAARAVITAGPWAQRLLAPLFDFALPLQVTHQQVSYFRADPGLWAAARCPIFIFTADPHVYGFPIFERPGLMKVARELAGSVVDPDAARAPWPDATAELGAIVAARLAGVEAQPVHTDICLYTETPTRDFIIDRHPAHAQIVVAAGFSGRGFKFGPGIGRLLADLAFSPPGDYSSRFWLDAFSIARLRRAGGGPPTVDLFHH